MKTKNIKILCSIFTVAFILATAFFVLLLPINHQANAEEVSTFASNIEDITDRNGYFTMKANPVSRQGSLQYTTKEVATDNGKIKFYCFNWREISSITFSFSSSLAGSKSIFTGYQFLVSSIQTEKLETSMGQADTKLLVSGTIQANTPTFPNVYYYFDSNASTSDAAYKFSGNDFGLYKFDFNYTFVEDASPDSASHTLSIGELYIAILPDDIDKISVSRLSLTYSVTSSKELMNIYNVTFSNQDIFKYVNPKYIKWTVFGKDKNNADYVLTKQIRDNGYLSYKYIWEALEEEKQIGSNFVLDTNNIEGDWTVHCTIYNSDWTEKTNLTTGKLSTIKHKEKSYVWLIIGIIFGVILIIIAIILLIFWNRSRKRT